MTLIVEKYAKPLSATYVQLDRCNCDQQKRSLGQTIKKFKKNKHK